MSLLSKSGWTILTLMSLVVATAAGSSLLQKYPHPVEDISVVIALPLSVFWAIPSVLLNIWPSMLANLGSNRTTQPLTLPPLMRIFLQVLVVVFSILAIFALIALSMLAASLIYPLVGVAWASPPIHSIAIALLKAAGIPTLLAISFLAGVYSSTTLRHSMFWHWFSNETRKAASHFQQAA